MGVNRTRLTLMLTGVLVAMVSAELIYRWMLFGGSDLFSSLRDPRQYADYFSDDDYWKLYHRFGGRYGPPGEPHETLGWVHQFDRETYLHARFEAVGQHRPVLIYGDSFAVCVETEQCFQSLLEDQPEFAENHRVLNYGVGGYGLDQIMMLYERSVHHFEHPFVVIMVMPFDLDRSVLSVRVGQKPFFVLADGALSLKGVPVHHDADEYFAQNPPQITSYVYRKLLFSSVAPRSLRSWLRGEGDMVARKKALGDAMFDRLITDLRSRQIDFVFAVFHTHWPEVSALDSDTDWRDIYLRDLFERRGVPYIWSKDLLRDELAGQTPDFDDWIIPTNGHPTTRFNRLMATAIRKELNRGRAKQ